MTGIILMSAGLLAFLIGGVLYLNSSSKENINNKEPDLDKVIAMAIADGVLTDNEKQLIKQIATEKALDYEEVLADVEARMANLTMDSETEMIDYNKKNGIDFEKFIIQKFNKKYFKIKEWAGDKYINGIYAETTPQPDIRVELRINSQRYEFAVECKWRKKLYKGGVEFATEAQIERYRRFQDEMKIPVFIAIGIGGKGLAPEDLYLVPLSKVDSNFIPLSKLKNYKKNINTNFYFDIERNVLT